LLRIPATTKNLVKRKSPHILLDGYQLVGGLGSVGTYTCELVDGLVDAGCRITLAIPRRELNSLGEALVARYPELGIAYPAREVHPDTSYQQLLIWNHRLIPEIAKAHLPDFHISVYHHTPSRMPAGTKCLTVIHDCCGLRSDSGYTFMGRAMLKHWTHLKSAAMFADAIVPISSYTRSSFVKHFPSAKSKTREPIYNCVSAKRIGVETKIKQLKLLGLETHGYLVGLGMASKRKGMDMMMRGYSEYRNQSGRLPLVLYGGGNFEPTAWGLDSAHCDSVRKLGRISDETRDSLFAGATALLFPSRCEGFGYPIIEAAKQGCPVVAWAKTTASEILPHEDWMEDLEPSVIAEHIRRKEAMSDEERTATAERLTIQADRFQGAALASEYMKVFHSLTGGYPEPLATQ